MNAICPCCSRVFPIIAHTILVAKLVRGSFLGLLQLNVPTGELG